MKKYGQWENNIENVKILSKQEYSFERLDAD